MTSLGIFLQSPPVLALLIAIFIFIITLFLVVKRWIGFSLTLVLLFFSLMAGFIINNQTFFTHYFVSSSPALPQTEAEENVFHKQLLQAVEDLKIEVNTEKENLSLIADQIQGIFNSMDTEKQKLQHFIEETREKFQLEYSLKQKSSKTSIEDLEKQKI